MTTTCTDASKCKPHLLSYPKEKTVTYTNDREYREAIRDVFQMVCQSVVPIESNIADLDEITLDEYNYDQDAMREFLDYVYDATSKDVNMMTLYKEAAALMFSEDEGIGLAVLFSYDYFQSFHVVLCEYFRDTNDKGSDAIENMRKKIRR